MRLFINAKTVEACENILSALDETTDDATLCFTDEQADRVDFSAYDAVIVSTPLRSEFGLDFVAKISKKCTAPIIVLARADIAGDVQSRLKFTGAFVLEKPFQKSVLRQTIKTAVVAKENINRLISEKTELSRQLDDVRVINRAKCCLIQYLNLTEEQAHRHIQKLAMDTQRTQREIAENILRTYAI